MTTSICELVLRECQGIQLERQAVSFVETLEISGYGSLKEFASELVTLTSLKYLRIGKCTGLLSFADTGFPPMLTRLSVRDCVVMQCFPRRMMRLNNLKELSVSRCLELVLPLNEKMSHCYTTIEQFYLDGCQNLKSLPLVLFPKLRNLAIRCCINFEILLIPDGIELQNLAILNIEFCHDMVCFPRGGLPAPKLSCLWVEGCKKLKALPEQMHTLLPSLQSLWLWDCSEIESFPEGGLPSTLSTLNIQDCKKLVGGRRDWGLQALPSLTRFTLCGESEDMESFPEEGLLPSTLTSIDIVKLPNLKSLNKRGLQLLGSLECMEIKSCPQLQSLPEEGLPTSLFELHIDDCPLLKPRCRREEGDDWHKVALIRVLIIHGEAIFD